MKMNVVILAGGKMSTEDPLFFEGGDGSRCMIDLGGKPMVQWVIDALDASESIHELYVIGLTPKSGLHALKPLHFMPDENSLFDNIRTGVLRATEDHPSNTKVMIASGDIPAVRPEMIDWLAEQVSHDSPLTLYYNVITKETMEARYPKSNRSFVKFQDIAVCGGDINAIDKSLFDAEKPIWNQLAEARKNPLKQVSFLGFGNLLLVALRLVTLEGAVSRVCKKLEIKGNVLICPFAEMAMDADKPHQLEILRIDLTGDL